jgi:DcmR-like sensory protein
MGMTKSSAAFWAQIAPCDHILQVYQRPGELLDSLESFVAGGLRAGEGVLVVATQEHLCALVDRLVTVGIDVNEARSSEQYIDLDAEETLARFMRSGWPDEELFERLIADLLDRAGGDWRRVRAFGEMVAVLWARGQSSATVRLEYFWQRLCREKGFSVYCAYPQSGFTPHADAAPGHEREEVPAVGERADYGHSRWQASLQEICMVHSRVLLCRP